MNRWWSSLALVAVVLGTPLSAGAKENSGRRCTRHISNLGVPYEVCRATPASENAPERAVENVNAQASHNPLLEAPGHDDGGDGGTLPPRDVIP